ncbi:MAG: glycosyltransferase [Treponema sp.]|nr:glycosyltransferase [Treponema sp.]
MNDDKKETFPRFSATISCYKNDSPKDFETAFLSIYNQTVRPDEIIITVDGPIPSELEQVVSRFEREFQAVILRSAQNNGQGMAHALAVSHAKYDYIAIMDADDISVPDRFEKQLAVIAEHPEIDVIGGQIDEFIGSPENVVGIRSVPLEDHMVKRYLRRRCPFNHVTILMNSHMVKEAGNYQDWHYNEDYFLYCRMLEKGAVFCNLPDILVHVRVGEEMYRRRGGWKYFKSEARLQGWMLRHKIISLPQYCVNVLLRLCVQVVMPNRLRGFVFQKLFRDKNF